LAGESIFYFEGLHAVPAHASDKDRVKMNSWGDKWQKLDNRDRGVFIFLLLNTEIILLKVK
jgi:hypothetical protein